MKSWHSFHNRRNKRTLKPFLILCASGSKKINLVWGVGPYLVILGTPRPPLADQTGVGCSKAGPFLCVRSLPPAGTPGQACAPVVSGRASAGLDGLLAFPAAFSLCCVWGSHLGGSPGLLLALPSVITPAWGDLGDHLECQGSNQVSCKQPPAPHPLPCLWAVPSAGLGAFLGDAPLHCSWGLLGAVLAFVPPASQLQFWAFSCPAVLLEALCPLFGSPF